MDSPFGIRLCDFELSRLIGVPLTTRVGMTFQYCAPETLDENEAPLASDVFSLALVIYFIATGADAIPTGSPLGRIVRYLGPAVDPEREAIDFSSRQSE